MTIPGSKSKSKSESIPVESQTDSEKMVIHSIKVDKNETAIHGEILPVNCTGRKLKVYLRKNRRPTVDNFDYNWTLPVSVLQEGENGSVLAQSGKLFLSNVQLNRTTAGTYYLGVLADAHDNKSTECPLVNYTLLSFTSSCRYWNKDLEKWTGDGCEVC